MANPQLEEGYTRIANSLLEALGGLPLSGATIRVAFTLIRLIYGYNRKAGPVSITRIARIVNCDRRTVLQCIRVLEDVGFVTVVREQGRTNIYKINKDYDTWRIPGRGKPEPVVESVAEESEDWTTMTDQELEERARKRLSDGM